MSEQIQYIGARYVIKVYENSTNPSSAEWQPNVNYEPLTLVTFNMGSYLSKTDVPASIGNPADNGEYWTQTGFYNGQIGYLEHEVERLKNLINGEVSNRKNADNDIKGIIETETLNRTEADTLLNNKIIAETNARIAADNELALADTALGNSITGVVGDLTLEITNRTNADTAINARIDQIIAPTGEAPSPAEITDARIGADGVTYNSLGDAIRTQFEEILYWKTATAIVPNDDLDSMTGKGAYVKAPSTTPVSNLPPFIAASTGFTMLVVRNSLDYTTTNFMQIVFPNRDDHIYYRNHDADGFTAWMPVITADDRYNSAFAVTIAANGDVNSLAGTGIYQSSSSNSNTIAHLPRKGGFTLFQMYGNSAHNTYFQYIVYGGSGYSFLRIYDSSSWGDWMQVTGNADIPDYWETEIASKNTAIDNNCAIHGLNNDSFLFITDVHAPYVYPVFYKLLKYVIDHTPITKIFNGGDSIQDSDDASSVSAYKALLDNLSFEDNVMSVRGNHDTSHTNWFYGLMLGRLKDTVNMGGSLDYVYDVQSQKMRYIFVDCNDPNNASITSAQQIWLANKITEVGHGWTVLIITHALWKANGTTSPTPVGNYATIQAVIDSVYDTCDAQIVGVLSGHVHQDYYEVATKGYLLISRTTPAYNQASTDPNYPTRTQGTTGEIAFDAVNIDPVAGVIKFVRVGVGENLTLEYNLKT